MDQEQVIQSEQYDFPYHYIPTLYRERGSFSASQTWSYSLSYVTALYHVVNALEDRKPELHLDIGCGDGALLYFLKKYLPQTKFIGVDYDKRPINWARMFSSDIQYYSQDISEFRLETECDTASLIEVLEHIPPALLGDFISSVRTLLNKDSLLIVTVPHSNKPVSNKHYQHFTFESLRKTLAPFFYIQEIFGFEYSPVLETIYRNLLQTDKLYVESEYINRIRLKLQLRFKDFEENKCGRIFAIARPL